MSNYRLPHERPLITAMGETKSLLDWSLDPRCCVCYDTLRVRLNRGWRMYRAMTTKPREVRSYAEFNDDEPTPPRTYVNAGQRESYVPPTWQTRAGADDHLNHRSLR